ncbi:MAG: hypothetical protein ABSH20_00975 [Tepidisphaeraceae bacterium]|jgi:hypothetical protein
MKRTVLIALLAFALMPVAAYADHGSWGIGFSYNSGGGIGFAGSYYGGRCGPRYGFGAAYAYPTYACAAPVYVAPAPVYAAPAYVAPAPTYYAPAPVYYAPAPVYVAPTYYYGYDYAPTVGFGVGFGYYGYGHGGYGHGGYGHGGYGGHGGGRR